MNSKFTMSVADNIFYAKRNIVDSIYKEATLEGIALTFPETEEIYAGRAVASLPVSAIVKINNLKHAWQFIFDTITYPCDLQYVKQINYFIQAGTEDKTPGMIRNYPVRMGGTTWRPELPDETRAKEELAAILSIINPTERAISVMLYLMRAQLFGDGNKRTAQIVANQIMIQNGQGILAIPVEKNLEFKAKLVRYYETGADSEIKDFIFEHAIDGFTREITTSVSSALTLSATYSGTIIASTASTVTQRYEENTVIYGIIEHKLCDIVAGQELLTLGNVVTINYQSGKGRVTLIAAKKEDAY